MTIFTKAMVRPPAPNFSEGLTTAGLGVPDYQRALSQHREYCAALERCGLTLTTLEPDSEYPDSTFVEDTAVLTERCAVLARPGAPSRIGEAAGIKDHLANFYPALMSIQSPGTLDGGDVCALDQHFFIGISERTNEDGARQLAEWLTKFRYTATLVDIRKESQILHLKSGLSFLGGKRVTVIDRLANLAEFHQYELVRIPAAEEYAANCVLVNDSVLVAAGYPAFALKLEQLGYQTIALDVSEFRKMDGGLSCLSLRF